MGSKASHVKKAGIPWAPELIMPSQTMGCRLHREAYYAVRLMRLVIGRGMEAGNAEVGQCYSLTGNW